MSDLIKPKILLYFSQKCDNSAGNTFKYKSLGKLYKQYKYCKILHNRMNEVIINAKLVLSARK